MDRHGTLSILIPRLINIKFLVIVYKKQCSTTQIKNLKVIDNNNWITFNSPWKHSVEIIANKNNQNTLCQINRKCKRSHLERMNKNKFFKRQRKYCKSDKMMCNLIWRPRKKNKFRVYWFLKQPFNTLWNESSII